MKLKALRGLRYASKSVLKGTVFECKPADARLLVAAKIAEHYVEPPPKPVPAVFKPIAPFVPSEAEVEIAKAFDESKKRGYKRRDMTAE